MADAAIAENKTNFGYFMPAGRCAFDRVEISFSIPFIELCGIPLCTIGTSGFGRAMSTWLILTSSRNRVYFRTDSDAVIVYLPLGKRRRMAIRGRRINDVTNLPNALPNRSRRTIGTPRYASAWSLPLAVRKLNSLFALMKTFCLQFYFN
jgi:hypothetical protein